MSPKRTQAQERVLTLLAAGNRVFARTDYGTPGKFAYIERPGLPNIWIGHATIMALRSRRAVVQTKVADRPGVRFEYTLPEPQ